MYASLATNLLCLLPLLSTHSLAHPVSSVATNIKHLVPLPPLVNTPLVTASQIVTISPNSKSCDNPPAAGECATAAQAAPYISKSFEKYQVTSRAEQAAIIGLMAFESGDFKYNKNHFPGVPGQGTRNMQSPTFNKEYAESIPALKDRVAAVSSDPAAILDLLLEDGRYDFGSGAWFLTTQCQESVRKELQTGSEDGWRGYITSCVGTAANEERKAYWTRAVQALGV